jgi:hypothetical protein
VAIIKAEHLSITGLSRRPVPVRAGSATISLLKGSQLPALRLLCGFRWLTVP